MKGFDFANDSSKWQRSKRYPSAEHPLLKAGRVREIWGTSTQKAGKQSNSVFRR